MPHSPSLPRLASLTLALSLLVALVPVVVGAMPAEAQTTSTLVINEIDYDQPSTDTAEYLEIKNVTEQAIDLDPSMIDPVWDQLPWTEVLPQSKLQADSQHHFTNELKAKGPFTHVRLSIYPDGGVSRLRLMGRLAPR